MASRLLPFLILLLATLLLISTSCFVVREQELALRVQLSRIVSSDYEPACTSRSRSSRTWSGSTGAC
jgi:regulator of protease activity HflC (stomatin/prohibitin superfamily)